MKGETLALRPKPLVIPAQEKIIASFRLHHMRHGRKQECSLNPLSTGKCFRFEWIFCLSVGWFLVLIPYQRGSVSDDSFEPPEFR